MKEQPERCKICGYKMRIGDSYIDHTIKVHYPDFILRVLLRLTWVSQMAVYSKNMELFE